MAVRSEDLSWQGSAVIYRFPVARSRPRRRARLEVVRRRLALGAIAVVVVAAAVLGTGPGGVAPASPAARRSVVLQAGDTLWDVAARHAPAHMDTRAYLDAILELNRVGPLVQAGTRIQLP